jgi:hypothetical protein
MLLEALKHPIQLLSDAKGIYGVGSVASSDYHGPYGKTEIILRPDKFSGHYLHPAALQMIFGGLRHGMFSHMAEERLRGEIHQEMLRRNGLHWPPDDAWWSNDAKQQARNRQIYHGLRRRSMAVINKLIHEALGAAAEPNALALARRFRLRDRYNIYRWNAASPRALQLTDAFPALGLAIVGNYPGRNVKLAEDANRMVENGVRMRDVADLMGVPMAFRAVKPGAAHLALTVFDAFEDPRLIDAHMPKSLPKMKLWLLCINLAHNVGPDFVQWTTRHADEIDGSADEVVRFLEDTKDWVLASYRASVPPHIWRAISGLRQNSSQGEKFINRQFTADMSLATVTKLNADWHEAVAANMTGPDCVFPDPWCPGGIHGGFDIVPVTTSADLYLEGRLMHHCVGTYGDDVRSGRCYIFSVRKDQAPIATLELVRGSTGVTIGQIRGPCNKQPEKVVLRAANSWFRAQKVAMPELTKITPELTLSHIFDDDGNLHF